MTQLKNIDQMIYMAYDKLMHAEGREIKFLVPISINYWLTVEDLDDLYI